MFYKELSNEARRQLIDTQQRGEALRAVRFDLRRRFDGSMTWKERDGREYLYRRRLRRVDKSLGVRSAQTETMYAAFTEGRRAVDEKEAGLRRALETMAPVNRVMGLGRIPRLVARILRRLDEAGVLGDQVCVVGTNALFAYEAHAGIRFESSLLATADIDIALDARRRLRMATRMMPNGLIGLLRQVDKTFGPLMRGSYRAANADGFVVDLITAQPRGLKTMTGGQPRRLGGAAGALPFDDVEAAEVPRLEVIVDAPRFMATAIDEDGLPVWVAAADPRWWAAHKLWLAEESSREPLKRERDRSQAMAVATMLARTWSAVDLSDDALKNIPAAMRASLRNAVQASARDGQRPEW